MFRVPIDGPADVFCDNQSVINNVSIPYYVLNMKHNFIFYHRVWEAHTYGTIRVGWISGEYNKAHIGTKTTIVKKKQYELLNSIFNEKVSTNIKKSKKDDGETYVASLMEVSKYLLYGIKPSLESGSEYEFWMSFKWINKTVARNPIDLQRLS